MEQFMKDLNEFMEELDIGESLKLVEILDEFFTTIDKEVELNGRGFSVIPTSFLKERFDIFKEKWLLREGQEQMKYFIRSFWGY